MTLSVQGTNLAPAILAETCDVIMNELYVVAALG